MSTVTLSNPHCAITSAEKPEGIASQAFTTALPEAQTFFTLFATLFPSLFQTRRHCEEPGDDQVIAPLYAGLAHAAFAPGSLSPPGYPQARARRRDDSNHASPPAVQARALA